MVTANKNIHFFTGNLGKQRGNFKLAGEFILIFELEVWQVRCQSHSALQALFE